MTKTEIKQQTCPICQVEVPPATGVVCDTCQKSYHQDCWDKQGKCATENCEGKSELPPPIPCESTSGGPLIFFLASLRNIFLVAGNTITGVLRGVVLNVLLVLAALMIIASCWTSMDPKGGHEVLIDSGLAGITVLGALIAILTGFTLIPNEVEGRTLYPVLSKPVRRWQFVLGKFIGAAGVNGITVGLLSVLLFVLFMVKFNGQFDSRMIMASVMIFAMLTVLSALIIFLSTFMSWIGTIIVSMVIWLFGNYSQFIHDLAVGQERSWFSTTSMEILQKLLPNFQAMDLRYAIVQQKVVNFDALEVGKALGNGGLYLVIALALAVLIFNYREL